MPSRSQKKTTLAAFECALLSVAPIYFSQYGPDRKIRYGERIFAYELYHQIRIVFPSNYYMNGGFVKTLSILPGTQRQDTIIPDLVIRDPATLDKNLLAVEIKSSPNTSVKSLLADFAKLEFYTRPTSGLEFTIGILLAVNIDAEKFIRNASAAVKAQFSLLATQTPRTAIWNIPRPDPNFTSKATELDSSCLKVLRAENIKILASTTPKS